MNGGIGGFGREGENSWQAALVCLQPPGPCYVSRAHGCANRTPVMSRKIPVAAGMKLSAINGSARLSLPLPDRYKAARLLPESMNVRRQIGTDRRCFSISGRSTGLRISAVEASERSAFP